VCVKISRRENGHTAKPLCLQHPPIMKYAKWGERRMRRLDLHFKQAK
jgi:hypothetical protein